jgi:HAD superfamily hydrolase (TIGR01549 family)
VQLDAILFDYGGTLDGPASHWLDRFVGMYAAAGAPIAIEQLKPAFYAADEAAYADPLVADMSLGDLMRFHVGVQHQRLGIENIRLRQRLIEAFVADTESALAASRAVLARLAEHHRLGVVSNFYGNVERILADAGFAPLLTVVADSNRVGAMKPDRRIFDHALAALGTAPEKTMHVGDSNERDVRAARALGLRTAWLVPADRGLHTDSHADLVVNSLEALENRIAHGGTEARSQK